MPSKMILILLVATVTVVIVTGDRNIETTKISLIKEEALGTAVLLRKLSINTQQKQVQFAGMASEFITFLNYGTFTINNAILNAATDEERKALDRIVQTLSNSTNSIQQFIAGDSGVLKTVMVETLEGIDYFATKFGETHSNLTFNLFSSTQLSRERDIVLYAIYKLKYQTIFFEHSDLELDPELDKCITQFIAELNSLTLLNKATEEALRDIIQQIAVRLARNIYKFQNWLAINPISDGDAKKVEELVTSASDMYVRAIRASTGNHPASLLRAELIGLCETALKVSKAVAAIEYPPNTGGQEFIRISQFDVITVARVYADKLKILLNTT